MTLQYSLIGWKAKFSRHDETRDGKIKAFADLATPATVEGIQ